MEMSLASVTDMDVLMEMSLASVTDMDVLMEMSLARDPHFFASY